MSKSPPQVKGLRARVIRDSRGRPTIEVELSTTRGHVGRASSPSGASTSVHEATPFPPGGVGEAVKVLLDLLRPKLAGFPIGRQEEFDTVLIEFDGTPNFRRLGGNTATALSMAYARCRSLTSGLPLWQVLSPSQGKPEVVLPPPRPPALVGNVINGGAHALGGPTFQEFLVYAAGQSPELEIDALIAVHGEVGKLLRDRHPQAALGRGDEGGWVAKIDNAEALEVLDKACRTVGDRMGSKSVTVRPGLDLAASQFFREGQYWYGDPGCPEEEQIDTIRSLIEDYKLAYVEDPFHDTALAAFEELMRDAGRWPHCLVVGDDIYASRADRVKEGIQHKASNAVLLKVNQVGTWSDVVTTVTEAQRAKWSLVPSHRSGETEDTWLAHVAVGLGAQALKCGVLGGERTAKLNELCRIYEPSP